MAENVNKNTAELKHNSSEFVETDLGLVRTFCQISKETNDPEIRTRNIHNAERAFQVAAKTFRDFSEQTEDWKSAKSELYAVERELSLCFSQAGCVPGVWPCLRISVTTGRIGGTKTTRQKKPTIRL